MRKISFLKLFFTYSISLSTFLGSILIFYFLIKDREILNKIGFMGIFIGLMAIIMWSLIFASWSVPRYIHDNMVIYNENPSKEVSRIIECLKKNRYYCVECSSNQTILKSKDIIINWFCGRIIIKKYDNYLSIDCSKIILRKIIKINDSDSI